MHDMAEMGWNSHRGTGMIECALHMDIEFDLHYCA
jgi:hypothetical protein